LPGSRRTTRAGGGARWRVVVVGRAACRPAVAEAVLFTWPTELLVTPRAGQTTPGPSRSCVVPHPAGEVRVAEPAGGHRRRRRDVGSAPPTPPPTRTEPDVVGRGAGGLGPRTVGCPRKCQVAPSKPTRGARRWCGDLAAGCRPTCKKSSGPPVADNRGVETTPEGVAPCDRHPPATPGTVDVPSERETPGRAPAGVEVPQAPACGVEVEAVERRALPFTKLPCSETNRPDVGRPPRPRARPTTPAPSRVAETPTRRRPGRCRDATAAQCVVSRPRRGRRSAGRPDRHRSARSQTCRRGRRRSYVPAPGPRRPGHRSRRPRQHGGSWTAPTITAAASTPVPPVPVAFLTSRPPRSSSVKIGGPLPGRR